MTTFQAEVAITPNDISRLGEQAQDFLLAAGVDQRAAYHVALVLDEVLTNVLLHGGAPRETATIRLDVDDQEVRADVRDPGLPFDPRTASMPERSGDITQREIGGLGLHIVRNVASELAYTREGTCNRTRFAVRRTQGHHG